MPPGDRRHTPPVTTPSGSALDGIRILDLTWGPGAAVGITMLAEHGADVVKVEPPGGDPFRGYHGSAVWHRSRRSISLDLKGAADAAVLEELLTGADVLVEGFRPRVMERLGYVTLVECVLETGRTHQIRVHMKHIGHTLFNDSRYGGHEILRGTRFAKYKQFVNNCFDICPRQALHAMTLGFVHPVSGEEMYFTSPLPDDMAQLLDKWRGYISNRELQ